MPSYIDVYFSAQSGAAAELFRELQCVPDSPASTSFSTSQYFQL